MKINRVPDSLKDKICTKFGQNPLKDVDPRVFTRMLRKDGRMEGRTDGSVTISLRNFVGEGIIKFYIPSKIVKLQTFGNLKTPFQSKIAILLMAIQ